MSDMFRNLVAESSMHMALDFPFLASSRLQIPSVEVQRDIHDSDELSGQIVTAKVLRDITIVGRTRRTLVQNFCST